ncbi:MAG: SDR family NAD(P)-dependent oxidoreductase [Campylobacterales bacterium]|nr:SDR family NAD(P)-dependent oxidoreductase [Campylobacterales bacterium]
MRHVLISGCSSGIGLYCANALHVREDFRVYATARKPEDVARLRERGLWACRLDLDSNESIEAGLAQVLEQSGGRLDVLFNNGAYGQPGAVEDLNDEALKAQFQTNVFGTQALTNLALKTMRTQGSGRIVYNSSVLGFAAMGYRGAYNASKFAIEGLADTLRLELEGSGIYVVLIEPGPITSAFRANALQKFRAHIDVQNSPHKTTYEATLSRLQGSKPTPFTLGPEAVYEALLQAITSPKPNARYRVTTPTKVLWYAKRLLPTFLLDKLLKKAT